MGALAPEFFHREQSPILNPLQLIGTIFAALLGLAFGSFLNVVVSRLPEGESTATPRSHCRHCTHTLAWWENLPLLSWIILRGRCRKCQTPISLRYPLVELAIAFLWAAIWNKFSEDLFVCDVYGDALRYRCLYVGITILDVGILSWLLVALASFDAQYFWLPDVLTYPGIVLGFIYTLASNQVGSCCKNVYGFRDVAWNSLIAIVAAASLIFAIRLAYWLIRRKEGMGLGDAKLMAMLGAWLGLHGALESFALAVFAASAAALIWLAVSAIRRRTQEWAKMPLPLGTFLCLAALSEIFYPDWLWTWYSRTFLP
jgi:leader peptidase (prepilin peptidase)/N-methyltransferase